MKKIFLLLLSVGLLAAKDDAGAKKPKPRFRLGKETTYVTEPLDAHGYIDYAAALHARLRRGVTPENNANVLLWKAFGPHPEGGASMPDDFFKWLGIKAPPEQGDYFISLTRFLREQRKRGPVPDANAIAEELSRCSQPWKASEHPNIAAWLKANEKPLALVAKATKRTHYYSPLAPKRTKRGRSHLLDARLPVVQKCRELTNALVARAMLRLGEGRGNDAWQDLLVCHRLGRLVARGAIFIEALVGIAIDAIAANADLAFLDRAQLTSEQIKNCLRDLKKLPPMPLMVDKVDVGERFLFLDAVVMLDRDGVEALAAKASNPLAKFFQRTINWEPALRNGNRMYDRMAKAMRGKDRDSRQKELGQIGKDLAELDKKIGELKPGMLKLLFAKNSDKLVGEYIGNIMIGLLTPNVSKMQNAADRCEQIQNNLYLAFALAAYHRDHNRYPKELDALKPKYLDNIPKDMFSGKPLIYRPTANGYLLYSVGVNGRDEQGRSYDADPRGDDLTVRMSLPKLKRK